MHKVTSIEEYILKNEKWSEVLIQLHELMVSTGLKETIKWNSPVYTLEGKNILGLGAFKKHLAIWFFQGVFLADPDNALINAHEGKTKALRQMRFYSGDEINERLVLRYTLEAIQNQKEGKELKPSKNIVVIPDELLEAFNQDAEIERCFKAFSSRKQYEFTHHIATAKRIETRHRRVDKAIPLILQGIGLNDKYR